MSFTNFVIDPKNTVFNALKLIDSNKKGFLIVVEEDKVVGALTDGDIRRAVGVGSSRPFFAGNNEPFFVGKPGANQWILRLPTTQIGKLFIPVLSSAQQP